MKLRFSSQAKKQIQNLPPLMKSGIRLALSELETSPYLGKPLQRELFGYRSLRYKRYRILYQVNTSEKYIEVFLLGKRVSIYEEAREIFGRFKKRQ